MSKQGNEQGYIRKEVAEFLKIRPSTTEVYVKRKIIEPEIANPSGKGTRRRFSKRNILEIAVAQRLVKLGFSLNQVGVILQSCRLSIQGPHWEGQDPEKELEFWNGDAWDKKLSTWLEVTSGQYGANPPEDPSLHIVRMHFLSQEKKQITTLPLSKEINDVHFVNLTDLKENILRM